MVFSLADCSEKLLVAKMVDEWEDEWVDLLVFQLVAW